MLLTTLYVALCLFGATIIHELGHYFAARWVALPIVGFQIGIGPTILKFSLQGVWFRFHLFPFGGQINILVFSTGPVESNRWRYYVLYAAGPLTSFVFGVIVGIVAGFSDFLAFINLFFGLGNLIPFGGTDGYCLWRLYKHRLFHGPHLIKTRRAQ